MPSSYSHYCRGCHKYTNCTHPVPELVTALCPSCHQPMYLQHVGIEQLTKELGLRPSEINPNKPLYTEDDHA